MLDDFFFRAVIGGVGVALLTGPLGCFIVWRRLAYFGDTLSHSALLGVALALLFELNVTLSVFAISVVVSLLLMLLQRRAALSSDTLLGLLAHSALAVGLVVLAFMTWVRVDLMGFLFGDILSITPMDLGMIWGGGLCVLLTLAAIWRPSVKATAAGVVVYAGTGVTGYGALLIIKHNDTYLSAYGHNDSLLAAEGQSVEAGEVIAGMGSTSSDSVKLHFEIRRNGRPIDPTTLLPKR